MSNDKTFKYDYCKKSHLYDSQHIGHHNTGNKLRR
ncbi:MAG: hypothetical protein ACI9A7_001228 [Cyclobacteriaceae bacterium]|jgi:hypothetical protein